MPLISLDSALIRKTKEWVCTTWMTMPRRIGGFPYEIAGEASLNVLSQKGNFSEIWNNPFQKCVRGFHDLTRNGKSGSFDLWKGDHDIDFKDVDRNHLLNIASLLLASNISENLYKLSSSKDLPPRNTKDLSHWMSTEYNWFWSQTTIPFNRNNSVEDSVRGEIENAWRSLDKKYNDYNSLRWENTAICAIDAVYPTVKTLERANDLETFKAICQKTHELMIKHNLWGNDTKNPDRVETDGTPKKFDNLSPEMKENYVLIVLAALNGVSDFQAKQVLDKDPYL